MSTKEEIADKIVALGTKIRDLKAAKVSKAELDPSIAEYLALKERSELKFPIKCVILIFKFTNMLIFIYSVI